MQHQNKILSTNKFRNSLIFKLTAYMVVFTTILIIILFNYLNQPYTAEGELEAQEAYLYASMVEKWGIPPNLNQVKSDKTGEVKEILVKNEAPVEFNDI